MATDAPYNIKARFIGGRGATKHDNFVMAHGEMSEEEYRAFLKSAIEAWLPVLPEGALLYMAMDWRHSLDLQLAARELRLEHINTAVWCKTAGMGSYYRSAHEFWLVFRKPGASHRNNIQLGRFGRMRSNVWAGYSLSGFKATRAQQMKDHPTPKPAALLIDLIKDSTARGETVLDPFAGSGTCMIAAQAVGRLACLVELDPRYIDVILRRYHRLFGRHAVHRETGMTLDELGRFRAASAGAPPLALPPPKGGERP
ncbi:MAG: site-specific DNA-methyltransferase [Hyphomonadaceae bacterium]|nr:site-specific DNA-methyltransferase [Hyphomonadaceae bacterium]